MIIVSYLNGIFFPSHSYSLLHSRLSPVRLLTFLDVEAARLSARLDVFMNPEQVERRDFFPSSRPCPNPGNRLHVKRVESIAIVRIKNRRMLFACVAFSGRCEHSLMFYSPTVIRNGTLYASRPVLFRPQRECMASSEI